MNGTAQFLPVPEIVFFIWMQREAAGELSPALPEIIKKAPAESGAFRTPHGTQCGILLWSQQDANTQRYRKTEEIGGITIKEM